MENVVREGFICAECKMEFSTPEILTKHYFVHLESVSNKSSTRKEKHSGVKFFYRKLRNSSHTEEFMSLRQKSKSSNNYEANKVILVLEKLLEYDKNSAYKDRKSYEESLVTWIGQDAMQCPLCGAKFGLRTAKSDAESLFDKILDSSNVVIRLKHHCRLCGFIMCGDCSNFLKESYAKEFVKNITQSCSDFSLRNEFENYLNLNPKLAAEQDGDEQSEASSTPGHSRSISGEYNIRICYYCLSILNKKFMSIDCRKSGTERISTLYRDLITSMNSIKTNMNQFNEILQSLSLGEDKYSIEGAQTIRQDMINLFSKNQEASLALSKLKENDKLPEESPALVRLVNKVLAKNQQFIKTYMPSLKSLPTIEDYEKLKSQNKLDLAAKWSKIDEINHKGITLEDRDPPVILREQEPWIPKGASGSSTRKDYTGPNDEVIKCLVQQIENVMDFIENAQKDGRPVDEVNALTDNLTQLQFALTERHKEICQ